MEMRDLVGAKIHLMHVGDMTNKGTEALLRSDVVSIRQIVGDVFLSVSTTDVRGVESLDLPVSRVLPVMVDIPYKTADRMARKLGIRRNSLKYRVLALGSLMYMVIQTVVLIFSIMLKKIGFRVPFRDGVLDSVESCDMAVSCSDENFKEAASLLPSSIYWTLNWWSMLYGRVLEVLAVRSFGKPIVLFPNSIGPFNTLVGRFLAWLTFSNLDYILVREAISYKIADSLGVRNRSVLTYDAALLFEPSKRIALKHVAHPAIGVCPGIYSQSLSRQDIKRYISENAKALDLAIDRCSANIVLLPHYITGFDYDDLEISRLVRSEMKNQDRVRVIEVGNLDDFKSYLDDMDIIVSSKMHPAVLGISGCVPVVCIAYDHKQIGFFDGFGLGEFVIDIKEVSCGILISKIERVWNERAKIADLLRVRVPEMKSDVKKAMTSALAPYIGKKITN
jgi:colanic acid/amylovoran biosynthesis protein